MSETIGQLMTNIFISVPHDATVQQASQKMRDASIGSLLVKKDHAFVGILTDPDVVRKVAADGLDVSATYVHQVMSSPILTIDKHASLSSAVDMMVNAEIRHLIVTDGGKIVGLFSVRDLLAHLKMVSQPDKEQRLTVNRSQ